MATSGMTGKHDSAEDSADDAACILGPSDSSGRASDSLGQRADLAQTDDSLGGAALKPLEGDSDASGTGERADGEVAAPPDGRTSFLTTSSVSAAALSTWKRYTRAPGHWPPMAMTQKTVNRAGRSVPAAN